MKESVSQFNSQILLLFMSRELFLIFKVDMEGQKWKFPLLQV